MNVLLNGIDFNQEWAFKHFSKFINKETRILIIPFAFHDEWIRDKEEWQECYNSEIGKFYKGLVQPFLSFGVYEQNIRFLDYFTHKADDLDVYLKETDLIFFIGGLPDKTILRLRELGMMNIINEYHGIIMGWSAGASMQCDTYYIAPDKDYKFYSLERGLSHIKNFAVQVHYNESDVQVKSIEKFINDTGLDVYTLKNESAIVYVNNKVELIGEAKKYIV